jgi:hypothetical protein
MSWSVVLDPAAAIDGRTALDLNDGALSVDHAGIDWGESAIKAFMAEQRFGETPSDYRVPNRIVTIPMGIGMEIAPGGPVEDEALEELARRRLQQKVGLLQRQGGALLRQRAAAVPTVFKGSFKPGSTYSLNDVVQVETKEYRSLASGNKAHLPTESLGEWWEAWAWTSPLYADIVNASLTLPDVWGETGSVEPGVVLKLECLPDFYGDEIELDAVEQRGQIVAVLEEGKAPAVIKGDYPARTRIVLTEKGSGGNHNQKGLLWGLRSTHYDSAASAALFYDAYLLTPINGATIEEPGSGFSGNWIHLHEPQVGIWHPFLHTDLVSGAVPLSHLGSYRMWARVLPVQGSELRLAWSVDDAAAVTYNPAVVLGASIDEGAMVDLGEIRIDKPPVGDPWWRGVLQVKALPGVGGISVDRIWLQPIDDGAGKLRATSAPTSTLLGPSKEPATGESNNTLHAGKAWTTPTNIQAGNPSGGWAQVAFAGPAETSQALVAKAMGFALPTGVTIKGIAVTLGGATESGPLSLSARMLKAGALVGAERSGAAISGTNTLGGPADLWGTTWTPAQINEAAFGVATWLTSSGSGFFTVDTVTIRVYYSYSAGAISADAVLYSNRKSEIRFDSGLRQDVNTNAYIPVSELTGDLPRLPPSGLEGRPAELFVKNSRGLLVPGAEDEAQDKIQAQVIYRPCYIGRI